MDYRALFKPIFAMSGITDLHIKLDADARKIIATGKHRGQPFTKSQSFAEFETMLNGDTTAPEQQTAADPPGSTSADQIEPPEQS